MKVIRRIQQAESLLKSYRGDQPLVLHLKQFFRSNKQFGSRDRKEIANLCFAISRLGSWALQIPVFAQRAAIAVWICLPEEKEWLLSLKEEKMLPADWEESADLNVRLKQVETLFPGLNQQNYFPLADRLGQLKKPEAFLQGHFQQPLVWFRCRSKRADEFQQLLEKNRIVFRREGGNSFGLPQGIDLEQLCAGNTGRYGTVQDLMSSACVNWPIWEGKERVWDACAASGGKSLTLLDQHPQLRLYMSDIRPAILENLRQRFRAAGYAQYPMLTLDLIQARGVLLFDHPKERHSMAPGSFDIILLDVPCSGSGTWSRNPEFMQSFNAAALTDYATKQRQITSAALPYLKKGGYLIYMTCSVFQDENEAQVAHLQEEGMELTGMHYLEGADFRADTLFSACLRKI